MSGQNTVDLPSQPGNSPAVLVTGANGFVGSNVASSLNAAGVRTIGLVRSGRGRIPDQAGEVRTIETWTEQALARALAGVDVVVHAASVVHRPGAKPDEYVRFNTEGTHALVEASRAVSIKTLILLSTIKVYGERPTGIIDEATAVSPDGGYASSKLEAERIVTAAAAWGCRPVVLRLCPVFGPGDKGNVRRMIRAIAGRRFLLPGSGSTRKSVVHIATVTEVVRGMIGNDFAGTFVVADNHAPSMRELADTIAQSLGRRPPFAVPATLLHSGAAVAEIVGRVLRVDPPVTRDLLRKSLQSTICSPARIEAALGLRCHVELAAAIDDEVAWMRRASLL